MVSYAEDRLHRWLPDASRQRRLVVPGVFVAMLGTIVAPRLR